MATITTRTLGVNGFHCSGCSDNLTKALSNMDGVIRARASFDDASVEVRYDEDRVSEQDIRDQIARSGFDAG
jgi:copper chaperone CopZ